MRTLFGPAHRSLTFYALSLAATQTTGVPRENERFADVPLEQADDVDVLERNFYRVLGVGKRANPAHIKQAYRKLSLSKVLDYEHSPQWPLSMP